jgi:glycerophosphoryl diester phosphodiesterase
MRRINDKISIGLLVENNNELDANLNQLGFLPNTYSPEYILVDEDLVKTVHSKGMKLIPWTVNEVADMKRLLNWDVDGIITDYPDRLVSLLKSKNDSER